MALDLLLDQVDRRLALGFLEAAWTPAGCEAAVAAAAVAAAEGAAA